MEWKYVSSTKDGIIDMIYCAEIEMIIPIKYHYKVLLKDGSEYYLDEIKINFTFDIDKIAINTAYNILNIKKIV